MNVFDFIFPKNCLECGKEGKYVCESCLNKVGKSGWYGRNYSIFRYEGVIRKAIIALKYKYSTEVAKELAEVCVKSLGSLNLISNSCLLIPIPLHWQRKNVRGFNQSEEVGKLIAKNMNWDFNADLLIKNKSTIPQVGLKGDSRRKNLRGVFSVAPNHFISNHYSLVLFDDVFTTGSTLKEAAKVLKRAGVEKVWGITIAR